jgi:hypothetical protein
MTRRFFVQWFGACLAGLFIASVGASERVDVEDHFFPPGCGRPHAWPPFTGTETVIFKDGFESGDMIRWKHEKKGGVTLGRQ